MPTPTGLVEYLGTVVGSAAHPTDPTATRDKVFDGDVDTYWVGNVSSAYVGRDLAVAAVVKRVRIAPQTEDTTSQANILTNEASQTLRIFGSNTSESAGLVTLHTHANYFPWFMNRQLNPISLPNQTAYRWVVVDTNGNFGRIGELVFEGYFATGLSCKPCRPTITPSGGKHPEGYAAVEIATDTSSATIFYTDDGTTPTHTGSNPTGTTKEYTGAFSLTVDESASVTLKALAYDPACTTQDSVTVTSAPFKREALVPGEDWYDDRGVLLESHGGGILDNRARTGEYLWYGFQMNRTMQGDFENSSGIVCYSSTDLMRWKFRGQVCFDPHAKQMERPHARYNPATGKYVLWVAAFGPGPLAPGLASPSDAGNCYTSDSPYGAMDWGHQSPWTLTTNQLNPNALGYEDTTFFADVTGTAYLVSTPSTRDGFEIHELTPAWTGVTGNHLKLTSTANPAREAPAMVNLGLIGTVGGANKYRYALVHNTSNFYDHTLGNDVRYIIGEGTSPLTATWGAMDGNTLFNADPTPGKFNGQNTDIFWADDQLVYVQDWWVWHNVYASRMTMLPVTYDEDAATLRAEIPDEWNPGLAAAIVAPPISVTIPLRRFAVRNLSPIGQYAAPTEQWTIIDANDNAVDLSGKLVRCVFASVDSIGDDPISQVDDTLTGGWQYNTDGDGITISGSGHNVVTLQHESANNVTPGNYRYFLWLLDAAHPTLLAMGDVQIIPAVPLVI